MWPATAPAGTQDGTATPARLVTKGTPRWQATTASQVSLGFACWRLLLARSVRDLLVAGDNCKPGQSGTCWLLATTSRRVSHEPGGCWRLLHPRCHEPGGCWRLVHARWVMNPVIAGDYCTPGESWTWWLLATTARQVSHEPGGCWRLLHARWVMNLVVTGDYCTLGRQLHFCRAMISLLTALKNLSLHSTNKHSTNTLGFLTLSQKLWTCQVNY